jgi:hypothetical protein
MPRFARHRLFLALAAVAIAGLLSMHGFDSINASVEAPTHGSHSADTEPTMAQHGLAGLCVFIATTVGLASLRHGPRLRFSRLPLFPHSARPSVRMAFYSGPPLSSRSVVRRL